MFEIHFGLRENPFVSGHQPRFVYPSPEHQEALAHLRFGIENREPFVLITGEVGTGKTTALYDVLIEWKGRVHVALINNSALTRSELLEEICLRLGFTLPEGSSKPQVLTHLERHLLAVHGRGERAVLLLDEAQNLDRDLLEEIRLLSNLEIDGEKLLQVFLVGQPELEERLSRPELRQLRQRISVHYRLKPLSYDDTERYIHHRISVAGGNAHDIFPADSCRAIYALSHGIPREINHICAQSLLGAYVDDAHVVRPEHVRSAAAEIEFKSVIREGGETGTPPAPPVAREPTPSPMARSAPPEPVEPPARLAAAPLLPPLPPRPYEQAPTQRVTRVPPPAPAEPPAPVVIRRPVPTTTPIETARAVESAKPAEPPRVVAPTPTAAPPQVAEPHRPVEPPRATEPPARLAPPLAVIERASVHEARSFGRHSPNTVEEFEDGDASTTTIKWLLGIVALAGLVVAAVLLVRFAPWSAKPRATAASSPVAAPAESTAAAPVAKETPAPLQEDHAVEAPAKAEVPPPPNVAPKSASVAARKPTPTVLPPTATRSAASDTTHAPAAASSKIFGVAVASFLDEKRAEAERGRLSALTKLGAEVRTVVADSVSRFELVLGSFPTQGAAERAASDLISRGMVDEARVVAQVLPPVPVATPR